MPSTRRLLVVGTVLAAVGAFALAAAAVRTVAEFRRRLRKSGVD